MRRISIAFLLAFLSTSVWGQFEHPDLKSGKAVVKNVVILPPNVKDREERRESRGRDDRGVAGH